MKKRAEYEKARALNKMAVRDIGTTKSYEYAYKKDADSSGTFYKEAAAKKKVDDK
jgi:hypothetical protein